MTDPAIPYSPKPSFWGNLARTLMPEWQNQQEQEPYRPSPSSSSSIDLFFAGFVVAKIVDLSGAVRDGEVVGLVREPLNPIDPNAITVLNTHAQHVGYVESYVAGVLSSLIDSGLIAVEGLVSEPLKNLMSFTLVCHILIFAPLSLIGTVRFLISDNNLQLFSLPDVSSNSSEEPPRERRPRREIRTYDQIFASVGAAGKVGKKRKIVEPPEEIISSKLFLHQKEALAWLIERENSCKLPPYWEVDTDRSYVNVLTKFRTKERPEPLQGGIFADEMGLGKTLTLLSLIAANRPGCVVPPFIEIGDDAVEKVRNDEEKVTDSKKPRVEIDTREKGKEKEETPISVSKKSRVKRWGSIVVGSLKKRKIDVGSEDFGPKTTLIVCTPAVLSTWSAQVEEHTRPDFLKVYLFHGQRAADLEGLQGFDIVLTTYGTLSAEKYKENSPIWEIEWWRIILDEAHIIKNIAAQQSEAVIKLKGKRRWAVTGTPIQNGSFDLFSLMAFLKFQPFSIRSFWHSLVQRPLSEGSAHGLLRLQALMRTISLRRTKESLLGLVELPPITIETCFVGFSAEEREQYDQMESEAQRLVNDFIRDDRIMSDYSSILHMLLRLRQICNCLDLCPLNIRSFFTSCILEDVSNNPDLLTKMVSTLQEGDDIDCPVCLSPPTETVITSCAHFFCKACILKTVQLLNPCCPLCRRTLSQSDLFSVPQQSSDDTDPTFSSAAALSSKALQLLKLLVISREESPSTKSVIFSQFRKMLILLERPLKEAGFSILRLDGSLTASMKANLIKEFSDRRPGSPTVLLASLKAAGEGINLIAASRAYLLEPWGNSSVEEQAIGRVHRIGQKKEVKVVRLIVKNSIEERILELQERKKDLLRGASGKQNSKELKQMRLEELRTLLRL